MPASLKFTFLSQWWGFCLLYSVPVAAVLLLSVTFNLPNWLTMGIFILGLCSLFANLKSFHQFKHCVIAIGKDTDAALEDDWHDLHHIRRKAFIIAGFPAWIGALGACLGLDGIAALLLLAASVLQLLFYRIPQQLK